MVVVDFDPIFTKEFFVKLKSVCSSFYIPYNEGYCDLKRGDYVRNDNSGNIDLLGVARFSVVYRDRDTDRKEKMTKILRTFITASVLFSLLFTYPIMKDIVM